MFSLFLVVLSKGYVLSKEALRKFAEEAIPNKRKCRQDHGGAEDVEMGIIFQMPFHTSYCIGLLVI